MNWSGIRRVAEPRQVIASDFSPRKTERPKIESRGATTASITRAPVAASRLGVFVLERFPRVKTRGYHMPSLRDYSHQRKWRSHGRCQPWTLVQGTGINAFLGL